MIANDRVSLIWDLYRFLALLMTKNVKVSYTCVEEPGEIRASESNATAQIAVLFPLEQNSEQIEIKTSSVQLFYFMTSGPLKASHIKSGVKKKVEAAKRYTLRHAGCLHGCFTI